jgi:hypothetical protein
VLLGHYQRRHDLASEIVAVTVSIVAVQLPAL